VLIRFVIETQEVASPTKIYVTIQYLVSFPRVSAIKTYLYIYQHPMASAESLCLSRSPPCKIGGCWPTLAIRLIRLSRIPNIVNFQVVVERIAVWLQVNSSMAQQPAITTQTVPAAGDDVGMQSTDRASRFLTEQQVVYFHAGSELSYRRVQSTPSGKGSFTSIPVIDISQIDSESLDDRKAIARKLCDSCSTSGFFYIANHGVCLTTDRSIHFQTTKAH
jgi:hypothetical protein